MCISTLGWPEGSVEEPWTAFSQKPCGGRFCKAERRHKNAGSAPIKALICAGNEPQRCVRRRVRRVSSTPPRPTPRTAALWFPTVAALRRTARAAAAPTCLTARRRTAHALSTRSRAPSEYVRPQPSSAARNRSAGGLRLSCRSLLANRPRAAELLHACELWSVRHGVRQIPGCCSITFFISGFVDCCRRRVVFMGVRVHVHDSRRRTTSCAAHGRAHCEDHRAGGDLLGQRDRVRDRVEIEFCTASHAVDATSARRRGGVGLTPLDSVDMAASSPKVHPDSLIDFHTGPCSSRRTALSTLESLAMTRGSLLMSTSTIRWVM